MLTVYRPSSTRIGGAIKPNRRWACRFRFKGRECRLALFEDRDASDGAAARIRRLVTLREAGDPPDAESLAWLAVAPESITRYLARLGVIEPTRAPCPILALTERFCNHLRAKGATPLYIQQTGKAIERAVALTGAAAVPDFTRARVDNLILALRGLNRSNRTIAGYLVALKGFARWAKRAGYGDAPDLSDVPLPRPDLDPRRERAPLTTDAAQRLVGHAMGSGESISGMTGPQRACAYLLALEAGLRSGEIRSLTADNFAGGSLIIEARRAKGRRAATIPLRPGVLTYLSAHFGDRLPMPPQREVAHMLRCDLKGAGLPVETDFHCLRHTFITNLARAGVHPRTAQALARHSKIETTMRFYTHLGTTDLASAIAALPTLSPP